MTEEKEENSEDKEIIFSKLELLELDRLPRLKRFCSQNYTFKFPLLHCVTITECPQLTLFCPGTISTSWLQSIRVNQDEPHKDIWMADLNNTIERRFTTHEVISITESMALNAGNITMIRDVFPKVRTLYVESFKDEGVTFPHSSLGRFPKLNKLYVEHSSFEEIFPSQDEIINFMGKIPPFEELHIASLDQLKSIWKDDSRLPPIHQDLITILEVKSCHSLVKLAPSSASFQNLWNLSISGCHQLLYLMTSSTAKSLVSLAWLAINDCKKMEEIVLNENNEDIEGGITFSQLQWIELTDMPSLKMFSSQSLTFEFPELKKIEITRCLEMKLFCLGVLETPKLSKIKIEEHETEWKDKGDLNKTVEILSSAKATHNLEELRLEGKGAEMIGSGQFLMYHFPNVKLLHLYVGYKETTISYKFLKSFPYLKELTLRGHINEASGGDDVPLPIKLTLEYISNITSLVPLLVSSLNLTHLQVASCLQLTNLMTSSAARSLVHLTSLSISRCSKIEEIISKQEGENDEQEEVLFSKLQYLKLDNLPTLKRFCGYNYTFRFPLLDQLIITECPKFKVFSPGLIYTPSLKSVLLSPERGEKRHEIWDTNLNKTFYQQRFNTSSRELVLDEDDVSMIRNNDQFLTHYFPEVEILGIEGFFDEGVTFLCTLLERFPQLNELRVKHGSFEEIFPSDARIVHQIPPLRKLYLTSLDHLKNIMGDDSQLPPIQNLQILHVLNCSSLITLAPSSTSFHNLTVLRVSECHQLIYLMTNSMAKSLVNLETLEINNCKKMKEIVKNKTNEDVEGRITFNALRILELTLLPRLKTDEDKTNFNIEDRATNTGCRNIFRPLFSRHKVLLPKLEILQLSDLNGLIPLIWGDQLSHDSFSNLKTLTVQWCGFVKLMPLCVMRSLNNLEELEVKYCNMLETVFDFEDLNNYEEMKSSLVVVPLKKLRLEGLPKLGNVLSDNHSHGEINLPKPLASSPSGSDNQIEEIMTEEKEENSEDKEIIFSKLELLELDRLPRLKRFCSQNYTFKFPLLHCVTITECPQLTLFCPGTIYTPWLQSIRVNQDEPHKDIWMTDLNNTIQRRFTTHEVISNTQYMALNAENNTMIVDKNIVFPKVRTLYVESFQDEGVTFPYSSLERFPKLVKLYVEQSSFEEIFPTHDQIIAFTGKIPPFEELYIASLDQLKNIWKDDSQLPPIDQNLRVLEVESCCNLVKLAPSSISFENLWKLSVSRCHQLIHLVTSSTAKSLVSLLILEINNCKNMGEIIMNETHEDVESEITFHRLRQIELTDMPSLKMFSSQSHTFQFPDLQEIKITGCPKMKRFCPRGLETPKLSKVKIEGNDVKWEDDLNKTIEMLC